MQTPHGNHPSAVSSPAFDFDEWAQLARRDPQAFEARRRAAIEVFIHNAPARRLRRLRGLQFRIDLERRRAGTPMAACIRLNSMMWDLVLGREGLRERLQGLVARVGKTPPATGEQPRTAAKILQFPRRNR